jgi:hypothetical protein
MRRREKNVGEIEVEVEVAERLLRERGVSEATAM